MEEKIRIFSQLRDASVYINSIVTKGDLVLLKGTNRQDHLLRIIMARSNEVNCWRRDCGRQLFCSTCSDRMLPSGLSSHKDKIVESLATTTAVTHSHVALDANHLVIVGLGNPGEQFDNTPHNVGYEVTDQVATMLGLVWTKVSCAWVARGESNDKAVCLIKIEAPMNLIGGSLKQLSVGMSFKSEQCILIFDDINLPIGVVKTRQRGSAGGHRGVASILEAFQTDEFRRIKIGVGQVECKANLTEYVLTPFTEGDRKILNAAFEKVVVRIRDTLVRRWD